MPPNIAKRVPKIQVWPLMLVDHESNHAQALIIESDVLSLFRLKDGLDKVFSDGKGKLSTLVIKLTSLYTGAPVPFSEPQPIENQPQFPGPDRDELRSRYNADRYHHLYEYEMLARDRHKILAELLIPTIAIKKPDNRWRADHRNRSLMTRRRGPFRDGKVQYRPITRLNNIIGYKPVLTEFTHKRSDRPRDYHFATNLGWHLRGGGFYLDQQEEDQWGEPEERWFDALNLGSEGGSDVAMGERQDLVLHYGSLDGSSDGEMTVRSGDLNETAYLERVETGSLTLRGGGLEESPDMEMGEDDVDLHLRGGGLLGGIWEGLRKFLPESGVENASDRWTLDMKKAPTFKTTVGPLEKRFKGNKGLQPGKTQMIPLYGYQGIVWFRRGIFNSFVDAVDRLLGLDSRAGVTYNLYIFDRNKDYQNQEERDAFLTNLKHHGCTVSCKGIGDFKSDRVAFNWLCHEVDKQYRTGDSAYFEKLVPFVAGPNDPIPWTWEPTLEHGVGKIVLDWPELKERSRPDVAYLRLPKNLKASSFFTNQYGPWMQQICRVLVPGRIPDRPGRPAIPNALINVFTGERDDGGEFIKTPVVYGGLAFNDSHWEKICGKLEEGPNSTISLQAFAPEEKKVQITDCWHIFFPGYYRWYESDEYNWQLLHKELHLPAKVAERLLRPLVDTDIWKCDGELTGSLIALEVFFPGERFFGPHFGSQPVEDGTGSLQALYIDLSGDIDIALSEPSQATQKRFEPLIEEFAKMKVRVQNLAAEAPSLAPVDPLNLFPQFIAVRPIWKTYRLQDVSLPERDSVSIEKPIWKLSLADLKCYVAQAFMSGEGHPDVFDKVKSSFSITQGVARDFPTLFIDPSMTETEWEVARRLIVARHLRVEMMMPESLPQFGDHNKEQPFGYRNIYDDTPKDVLWRKSEVPLITHHVDWQLNRATPIEGLKTMQPWGPQRKVPPVKQGDVLPDEYDIVKPPDEPEQPPRIPPPPLTRPLIPPDEPVTKRAMPVMTPTRSGRLLQPQSKRQQARPKGPSSPGGAVSPRIAAAFQARAASRPKDETTGKRALMVQPPRPRAARPANPRYWAINQNYPGHFLRVFPDDSGNPAAVKPGTIAPAVTTKVNYFNVVHVANAAQQAAEKAKAGKGDDSTLSHLQPNTPPSAVYNTPQAVQNLDTLTKAKQFYTSNLSTGAAPPFDPTDPVPVPPVIYPVISASKPRGHSTEDRIVNIGQQIISTVRISPFTLPPPDLAEELRDPEIQKVALKTRMCPFWGCYLPLLRIPEVAMDHFRKRHAGTVCICCWTWLNKSWDGEEWDGHFADERHTAWLKWWCRTGPADVVPSATVSGGGGYAAPPADAGLAAGGGYASDPVFGAGYGGWTVPPPPPAYVSRMRDPGESVHSDMLVAPERGEEHPHPPPPRKVPGMRPARKLQRTGVPGKGVRFQSPSGEEQDLGYEEFGMDGAGDERDGRPRFGGLDDPNPNNFEDDDDEEEENSVEENISDFADEDGMDYSLEGPCSRRTLREPKQTAGQRQIMGALDIRESLVEPFQLAIGIKLREYERVMNRFGGRGTEGGLRRTRIRRRLTRDGMDTSFGPDRPDGQENSSSGEEEDGDDDDDDDEDCGGDVGIAKLLARPTQPPQPEHLQHPQHPQHPQQSTRQTERRRRLSDPDYAPSGDTSESEDVLMGEGVETLPFSPPRMSPGKQKKRPRTDDPSSKEKERQKKRPRTDDPTYRPDKDEERQIAAEDSALDKEFRAVAKWDDDVNKMLEEPEVERYRPLPTFSPFNCLQPTACENGHDLERLQDLQNDLLVYTRTQRNYRRLMAEGERKKEEEEPDEYTFAAKRARIVSFGKPLERGRSPPRQHHHAITSALRKRDKETEQPWAWYLDLMGKAGEDEEYGDDFGFMGEGDALGED
ncbi:hypothetical protein QBC36DRAFT_197855 [Triangularia setosa]|uniref:Uncharacterized protein n=1 Tax=Triangularia setosa TaxID=2587417 RepID=A0AAN6W0F1_9PEZI|nr:hypothetical protein QBC36DRAFT_197855 [Podospora setosa]